MLGSHESDIRRNNQETLAIGHSMCYDVTKASECRRIAQGADLSNC